MIKIDLVAKTTKKSKWMNSKTFIMLHHTAQITSLEVMTSYLSKNPAEVSVHYVISEDGRIAKIGKDEDILWHAGDWNLIAGYVNTMNANSIGIEVISDGKTFTKKSIDTLSVLVSSLQEKYSIPNDRVIRHKDYTKRKTDIWDAFFSTAWYTSYSEWLNRNMKSYEDLARENEILRRRADDAESKAQEIIKILKPNG
jgi:N-acetylmuramoyl-L-alanine amidase